MQTGRHSFRGKVLLSITICIMVFCLLSGLVITYVLGRRLYRKNEMTDWGYASTITAYMEDISSNVNNIALLARSNTEITRALSRGSLNTPEDMGLGLSAQRHLDTYLNASPVNAYFRRLLVFNLDNVLISSSYIMGHQDVTIPRLKQSYMFLQYRDSKVPVFEITSSLTDRNQDVLAYLYPLDNDNLSFIYMEFDISILTQLLAPYEESADIVIESTGARKRSWYSSEALAAGMCGENRAFRLQDYAVRETSFDDFQLVIKTLTMRNLYSGDNQFILYTLFFTLLTMLAAGFVVSRLVSSRITEPINELNRHIAQLSSTEELTENPEIEQGNDEISAIGRMVNRLVRHINDLLQRQKEMYQQKQTLEINALQAQINPHFLYNTLDSIRWMAVIQKSESIAKTVGALEELLRNMAKGVGDRITLREELRLVQDYVSLQQVRYMEIFDYICDIPEEFMEARIVKMTLQPVIENAILHGIEPTGSYGEIRLSARREAGDLCIQIEDNGVGMDEAELEQLKNSFRRKSKNAMSGIGVSNVDARLHMVYGDGYGLSYESRKNEYTRVMVRIPYETEA